MSHASPLAADQAASAEHLKHKVRHGLSATAISQVISQIASLVVLGMLYRLVDPEQFGLIGMLVPVLLFVRLFISLGLNVAAVQDHELSEAEVSALFWMNMGLGVAMTLAMAAASPLIAWFYGRPELVAISAVLAGTSLAVAVGSQHQTLLERHLRMSALAWIRLASQILAGVAAVSLAYAGWGVWALVAQQYTELTAVALFCWIVEPWRPQRLRDAPPLTRLLKFGGYYTLALVMHYISQNADKVLIGVVFGPKQLGLYSQAFNLMMKPIYVLTGPLTSVMLPALARARHDAAAYRTLLLSFYRLTLVACLPVGVGLSLVAPETMAVLGGEKWIEAGRLLQALAVAITVQGGINIAGSVLASVGRADALFHSATFICIVLCAAFAIALPVGQWFESPALAMAWSYSATVTLVIFMPYMRFCFHLVGVESRALFSQLAPTAWAAAGMAVCVLATRWALLAWTETSDLTRLATMASVGVVTYTALARHEVAWFYEQFLRLRRRATEST